MNTNQLRLMTPPEQEQTEPLLYALDRYASVCYMRLRGLITVCDQHIKTLSDGRISDWCFDHVFNELESLTDKIGQISWGAMQNKTLQNEIRAKLLSSNREQHDELYYGLIKDIYTNLGGCIEEIEKYTDKREEYNNFIKVRYSANYSVVPGDDETKEKDTINALSSLSKLAPGIHSSNLLNSARHIRYAIRSVIPNSDFHKILPVDELNALTISTGQEPEPIEPGIKLQWIDKRGGKTDLAELIYALVKSGRITDNTTNRPVTIDVLANQLGTLLGVSIKNPMQLVQGRKDSYKAADDGLTFTAALSELVDRYIADQ